MNPVFWLELRLRAREKRLWILALFYLLSLFVFFGFGMIATYNSETHISEPSQVGNIISWVVVYSQAVLLVILAPLASAGRLSQEREQRTLPALINSPISPASVCIGKLLGAWSFIIWLSCLSLPFLAISTLWGGPSWKTLALAYFFNLSAGLCLSTLSLGISGWFGRTLTAYLATGAFLFGWFVVMPILGGITEIFTRSQKDTEWVLYVFHYHNPFAPLIILSNPNVSAAPEMLYRVGTYALGMWVVLSIIAVVMAERSIRREIY